MASNVAKFLWKSGGAASDQIPMTGQKRRFDHLVGFVTHRRRAVAARSFEKL
jgi:hypothetical protein